MSEQNEYQLPTNVQQALQRACAAAAWSKQHSKLLESLRRVPGFEQVHLSAVRDHFSDNPARIVAGNRTVADSYRAWAREQLATHGGVARRVWSEFVAKDWSLTWTTRVLRYYWLQQGPHPWNGIQLTVVAEEEFPGGPVFQQQSWSAPTTAEELLNPPENRQQGAAALAAGNYRLSEAVNVEAFYRLGQRLHAESLERGARRRVIVQPPDGQAYESTWGKLAPDGLRYMWRVQRWFEDWEFSSAGRSGAVAGHHWAFQFSDWNSGTATPGRVLDLVPLWAHTARIGKIESSHRLSDQALYAKLLALDKRTGGVPFGWYFYMLHGNLVTDGAGMRVLRAAREGSIELPEHDLRVLAAWAENKYGF